jgi:FKBP-type peptidyl-prolyl cis-trans isomerase FklB
MQNVMFAFLCCLFIGGVSAQTNQMDSISYSLGVLFAQNLKQQGLTEVDAASLSKGFADALKGEETIEPDRANAMVQQHFQAVAAEKGAAAKGIGEAFLVKNAKRAEVKTTDSGLQYEVLRPGTGDMPKATDKVKVHYHGKLRRSRGNHRIRPEPGYSRLDRRTATDEGRREVPLLHSARSGLRPAWFRT